MKLAKMAASLELLDVSCRSVSTANVSGDFLVYPQSYNILTPHLDIETPLVVGIHVPPLFDNVL